MRFNIFCKNTDTAWSLVWSEGTTVPSHFGLGGYAGRGLSALPAGVGRIVWGVIWVKWGGFPLFVITREGVWSGTALGGWGGNKNKTMACKIKNMANKKCSRIGIRFKTNMKMKGIVKWEIWNFTPELIIKEKRINKSWTKQNQLKFFANRKILIELYYKKRTCTCSCSYKIKTTTKHKNTY